MDLKITESGDESVVKLHYGFLTQDTAFIELPIEIYDQMIVDKNMGRQDEWFPTTHPRLDVIPYNILDVGVVDGDGCFGVTFEVDASVSTQDIRELSERLK